MLFCISLIVGISILANSVNSRTAYNSKAENISFKKEIGLCIIPLSKDKLSKSFFKNNLLNSSTPKIKRNNNTFTKVRPKNYNSSFFSEKKYESSLGNHILNNRKHKFVNLSFLKFLITSKMLC